MSSQKHPFIIDTNKKREYNEIDAKIYSERQKQKMPSLQKTIGSQMVSKKQPMGRPNSIWEADLLRPKMSERNTSASLEKESSKMGGKLSCQTTFQENRSMRNMQRKEENRDTPQRRKQTKQQLKKSSRDLSGLSYETTSNESEENLLEETQEKQIGAFCVRKLMPCETEKLMSWPRDWTRWGINEKGEKIEISDSQRYKMCGNGVVSNVVREIVKNLL